MSEPGGMWPGGLGPFGDPAELAKMMNWSGGPVHWELAREIAVKAAAAHDATLTDEELTAVADGIRLADVWLDAVTTLPSGAAVAEAWTRVHWVEATLPVWRRLCDPVAARVTEAMTAALRTGLSALGDVPGGLSGLAENLPPGVELPEGFDAAALEGLDLAAMVGPAGDVIRQVGGYLFGAQIGSALAALSAEVLSAGEVGLPLGPADRAAMVPANVAELALGLSVPYEEVALFMALREAAHQRLFAHVGWLGPHLLGAVEAYARGIAVDGTAAFEAVQNGLEGLDPSALADPEALASALGSGMFDVPTTPDQQLALDRLETLLALVEGWVDDVVDAASAEHLPSAGALRETVRRRRATGGPAEQTFASLVGLRLRPRRLRDAAVLWRALGTVRGMEGRDALWAHPDLLPTANDLDDPEGFVAVARPDPEGSWDMAALDAAGEAPPEPPLPKPQG